MKIAIASDHAGFAYKEKLKDLVQSLGHEVRDYGTSSDKPVNYPEFIRPAAEAVSRGECDRAIVLGGSGNGEAMVANRVRGVRCALCWNVESARLGRQHNDANAISLGQRMMTIEIAFEIVRTWLETPFEGGRHVARIRAIDAPSAVGASAAGESVAGGYRTERDSMGEMQVPTEAYYGAQTARALENFGISRRRFTRSFVRALGMIKKHAAATNSSLGLLPKEIGRGVEQAAQEVAEGRWDSQFVLDVFQTGSGTSTNMNANEVIARRASEILKAEGRQDEVHPNDHVNLGQSSNDVIPSAIHLAALEGIVRGLVPSLEELAESFRRKTEAFREIIKLGRTHLQDATPLYLGQEFSGYQAQVENSVVRLIKAQDSLSELALGGTAVGTGLNTHPEFASRVIAGLALEMGLPLREARNHFEAQGARDACVETSGVLKTIATSLIKIANDIRLLGSGPRSGFGELKIPSVQPGSSIMPGKVNPVMCEMLIQAGAQVIGNDSVITVGGIFGQLELNTMMPVIADNLLESVELLTNGARAFARRCIEGLEVDADKCREHVERSLALVTALAPKIGYDKAAKIAKTAHESRRTLREVAQELGGLEAGELDLLLDPKRQAGSVRHE